MPVYTSEALILRTYKLGEADRIVVFLTRDRGKKRGVAKGARRPRSRFTGALEPMTRDESRDIYQLFVERTGKTATIITSNRDTADWLAVFDDPLLGQGAVDEGPEGAVEPMGRRRRGKQDRGGYQRGGSQ